MAAESFWNYTVDPRQQAAAAAPAGMAAASWQAPPPLPAGAPPQQPPPLKRQRPDSFDMPSGQGRAGFHEATGASHGHHLNKEMPYGGAGQTGWPLGGMAAYSVYNHHMMGMGFMGLNSTNMGSAWTNPHLPPDASNTLYVDGLPSNCTKREVSHIFRPFSGFCDVRLVNKESRVPGRYHVLCFVDFVTPAQALVAMETLQGYKFDEHDSRSANLRLEFSSSPGPRSGGGPSGRY